MSEIVTKNSEEIVSILQKANKARLQVLELLTKAQTTICGARYLTSEQVCENYGISRRALQKYRDERTIPYTSIAGKILYPLSEIERILQTNYKAREE